MFKKGEKLITKLLVLAICTSLVPTTVAFAEEKNNIQQTVTNAVQTTGAAVNVDGKNTTVEEVVNNELVNSSVTDESDFVIDANGTITSFYDDTFSKTEVVIPNTINGVSVTSIGYRAFKDWSKLTSITIPDTVTSIGDQAFWGCSSLTNITIPKSVKSIGTYVFSNCSNLQNIFVDGDNTYYKSIEGVLYNKLETEIILYPYNKKDEKYIIPNGVIRIGNYAFCGSSLTSIDIPSSVTSIGNYAFAACSSLTGIEIPDSVTSIGDQAFQACSSLKSITIPNGVTSIGYRTFKGCSSLTNITIPNSVKSIYDDAFGQCSSLKSITIPDGVMNIWEDTFSQCFSLTSVTIPNNVVSISKTAFYACTNLTSITIPDSVTSIGQDAFKYCEKAIFYVQSEKMKQLLINYGINESKIILNGKSTNANESDFEFNAVTGTITKYKGSDSNLSIPSEINGVQVVRIGDSAFEENSSLESVIIPNGVIDIGEKAFRGCSNLKNITIPNSVANIGNYAFAICSGLENVAIPNGVTNIGTYAFVSCSNLKNVNIPQSVKTIGYDVFGNNVKLETISVDENNSSYRSVDGVLYNKAGTVVIRYPEGRKDKSYTILDGTTSIAMQSFSQCISLENIVIPKSVTSIEGGAFLRCTGLTSIEIPNGVSSIEDFTFSSCTKLTSITIPKSVTSIGWCVFTDCGNLKSITIADGIKNIKHDAFERCDNAKFYVNSENVKQLLIGSGVEKSRIILNSQSLTVKATEVKLNTNSLNWTIGKTGKFTATVLPVNTSNKGLIWTTSNNRVATIDQDGNIKAVGAGTAIITCKTNDGSNKSAICKVVVTKPAIVKAAALKLNANILNWTVGKSGKFTATISPSNVSNTKLTWTTSNNKVATIDQNGNIKAVGAGSAIITCKTNDGSGKSSTCIVKIKK